VPELAEDVRVALRALVGTTDTANPVDLGPLADPGHFATALRLVARSGAVDAVLALVTPHPAEQALAAALLDVATSSELPVLASFLGHDGVRPELAVGPPGSAPGPGSVPSYASPESAVLALDRAASYAAWRARPQGEVPVLSDLALAAAHELVDTNPHDGQWLPADSAATLMAAFGLRAWPTERVSTVEQGVTAAGRLGWPVALKSPDTRWRNRVDVGAVRLMLDDAEELAQAWASVQALIGPTDLLVQPMSPPGVSTVVRLVQDPAVGPLLSLRLGGVAADLLVDPVTRTLPLTDRDATDLIAAVRGSSLLEGTDTAALADLLHRVARLAEDLPEVAEVLLDPVLVGVHGVTVLHAGVRLLPPELDPESGPRRLVGQGAAHLR